MHTTPISPSIRIHMMIFVQKLKEKIQFKNFISNKTVNHMYFFTFILHVPDMFNTVYTSYYTLHFT